jgi:cell division septation protein DedD
VEVRSLEPVPADTPLLAQVSAPTATPNAVPNAAPVAAPLTETPIIAAAEAAHATTANPPPPAADLSSGGISTVPVPRTLFIQAGAFSDPKNAERLMQKLSGGGYGKVFVRDNEIAGRRMYRVRIGPVPDVAEFDRIVAALEREGINDAHLALD